ncbi:MAG: hypothetical protein RIC55_01830 [Pirellulaceae bacterium]
MFALLSSVLVGVGGAQLAAQQNSRPPLRPLGVSHQQATPHGSDCAAQANACRGCADKSPCPTAPCQEPCYPAQGSSQAQGVFVAPQQPGTVQGPSNGFGLRGLEIEFPAWRLALPTVRFPSLFRTRASSRMLLERSEAAFMGMGAAGSAVGYGQAYGVGVGQANALAAVGPPGAAALSVEQIEALRAQESAALAEQMRQLEAARAEAADAKAQAAEQKLLELEEAERRLDEKIRRLQQCLEQLYSAQLESARPFDPAAVAAAPPVQTPAVFNFNRTPAEYSQTARPTAAAPPPSAPQRLPYPAESRLPNTEVRRASYDAASAPPAAYNNVQLRRLPSVGNSY